MKPMYSPLATIEQDKLVVATQAEKTFIRSDLVDDSIARFGGLAPDQFIIAI
jgi:hypothetical protein